MNDVREQLGINKECAKNRVGHYLGRTGRSERCGGFVWATGLWTAGVLVSDICHRRRWPVRELEALAAMAAGSEVSRASQPRVESQSIAGELDGRSRSAYNPTACVVVDRVGRAQARGCLVLPPPLRSSARPIGAIAGNFRDDASTAYHNASTTRRTTSTSTSASHPHPVALPLTSQWPHPTPRKPGSASRMS